MSKGTQSWTNPRIRLGRAALALVAASFLPACEKPDTSLDDRGDGRPAEAYEDTIEDLFKPMDGGIQLTIEEIRGRNMWMLWTAGNEQFWDRMARESYGLVDLLKMLDSRRRGQRFAQAGLINEPALRAATKPDEFGLWLDERLEREPEAIDPAIYGRSSGVMGFRLFPNPAFDAAARQAWDAQRYESDPAYAASPTLVRPYRVGVTCGACHAGFHPLNPPTDPENPRWENLASAIGNQYLREGRVFAVGAKAGGFFAEMLQAQPPGTADSSRIVTDHINNPTAINPIFLLGARLAAAQHEVMHSDFMLLPNQRREMTVPRLLADGADCIGMPGALLRAYVNTGMYSQHWLQLHNPLVGFAMQRPFSIKAARKHSVYWNSTEARTVNIERFLHRLTPLRLVDAPGGRGFLDLEKVPRGRGIFVQHCARCHSSRQPPVGADPVDWFARESERPAFFEGNFFGDEKRNAINERNFATNSARAFETNAMRGHMWDVFSSETYKEMGSPGNFEVWNPGKDKIETIPVPSGGPGFYRTPSLISLWTSAPFFHNNALGRFTGDPSVKGRLAAFEDAAEKLLWPDKRLDHGSIWRTAAESTLAIPLPAIPEPLHSLLRPHSDADGVFRLGPIPAGTPINLLANVDPEVVPVALSKILVRIQQTLREAPGRGLDPAALQEVLNKEILQPLFRANKCPDLIEDRGHTYGADLPDDDKRALIEFLKTI